MSALSQRALKQYLYGQSKEMLIETDKIIINPKFKDLIPSFNE